MGEAVIAGGVVGEGEGEVDRREGIVEGGRMREREERGIMDGENELVQLEKVRARRSEHASSNSIMHSRVDCNNQIHHNELVTRCNLYSRTNFLKYS